MIEKQSVFIKRLLAFSIGPIAGAAIGFTTTVITTRTLVPSDYGRFSMFSIAQSIIVVFIYLGFDQAYAREFNSTDNPKNILKNSAIFPFFFSLLMAMGVIFFRYTFARLLFSNDDVRLVIVLAVILPFLVISKFSEVTIRMEERARLFSFLTVTSKILNFGLIYVFFLIKKTYQAAVFAYALSVVITSCIELAITWARWPKPRDDRDWKPLKGLIAFSLPLVPANLVAWVLPSFGVAFLRAFSSYTEVGVYASATRIAAILGICQQAFSLFWIPTAYRWNENQAKIDDYQRVCRLVSAVMSLLFVVIVLSRHLIILLLGHEYKNAVDILPFLLLTPVFSTISEVMAVGISFKRKTYLNILVTTISAITCVVLSFFLVKPFGALGAAIASVTGYLVFLLSRTGLSWAVWAKFTLWPHFLYSVMLVLCAFSVLLGRLPMFLCLGALAGFCIVDLIRLLLIERLIHG